MMKNDLKCTIVTPLYIAESNVRLLNFYKETIKSIQNQTCSDWSMVLVDDNSNNPLLDEFIESFIKEQPQTIIHHKNTSNLGPGISRNIAIELAESIGTDIVVFQDQDDICHPRRIEVTKEAFLSSDTDLLYSHFIPIDENGEVWEIEALSYAMRSILDNLKTPLEGRDLWKKLFTDIMYLNLPSATSVRIQYPKMIPFPDRRSSEETYAWFLYSAHGASFTYNKEIPTQYRIPRDVKGSASRNTIGEIQWHQDMLDSFTQAFYLCSKAALERNATTEEEVQKLERLLYVNLAMIFKREGVHELAKKVYREYIR